jgi:hypothetical protein
MLLYSAVFSTSVNSIGVCLSTVHVWNIIDPPAAVILNRRHSEQL